ncbi:MAG: 3-isopropylmalate dehydratase [Planctomycetota bacterium]|jgi:3-isopropylmalate/(R)-2-methylmalate dehydratase small subunit
MDAVIRGKVYVLGDNVDTDQIIPAHYLSLNPAIEQERRIFGRYALSGVPHGQAGLPGGDVPFVDHADESNTHSPYVIVLAGRNFGCGSSREHAPLALCEAGIRAVVAESYARIFYRNSVNGGYLVPFESAASLIDRFSTGDEVELNTKDNFLQNLACQTRFDLKSLGDVADIVEAGGLFEYAKRVGML